MDVQHYNFDVFKAKPNERNEDGELISTPNDTQSDDIQMRKDQEVEQTLRCLRISPDGNQIACGDWHGNIRIHNLDDSNLVETHCIEAHENEVLSIDFVRYSDIE